MPVGPVNRHHPPMPTLRATKLATTATAVVGAAAAVAALTGCSPDPPPPPAAPPVAPSAPSAPSAGPVTPERAGQIATGRFGGRVLNVEPDTANGESTWEVEVADSQQGRIEVDVSQATGAVVEMERD